MTNRLFIGTFAPGDVRIRASKIGKNVLLTTLNPEDLSFDSTWKDGAVIYRTGFIAVTEQDPPHYTELLFGETLPSIPFVYFWRVRSSTEIYSGAEGTDDQTYRPYSAIATTTSFKIYVATNGTFGFMILRSMTNG